MPRKVLLAEDEKNVILGVRTCLDAVGYEVEIVEDGVAALEAIKREHPDLILLDLLMPKMDGFEVLKVLKEDEKNRFHPGYSSDSEGGRRRPPARHGAGSR